MRRTRRSWLPLIALGLVAAGFAGCGERGEDAGGTPPSALVTAAVVAKGRVEERLEVFGTLEFDLERTQTLTAARSGEVVEVSVVPGERVQRGGSLLTLGPVPRDSLEVQRAEIELEFARQALERAQRLAEQRLGTNQEQQAAEAQFGAARAVLDALGQNGSSPLVVRASADGVVAGLLVSQGSLVQTGQELARIAPTGSMAVRIGFEVEEMPRLAEGLPVLLQPVFSGVGESVFRAQLSRLHHVADPATQLVEGLIHIESPPQWAVAGARARAQVVLQSADDVVRVPRAALVSRGTATGVYAIDGGRVRFQPLELGVQGADYVEARSGVAVGQRLTIHGRTLLSDGMAVREAP